MDRNILFQDSNVAEYIKKKEMPNNIGVFRVIAAKPGGEVYILNAYT